MDLFELLVNATKETENKECCPLVVYSAFFNTAQSWDCFEKREKIIIDFEEFGINGKADFLYDNDDLMEYLKRRRIKPDNFKKALEKADKRTAIKMLTMEE